MINDPSCSVGLQSTWGLGNQLFVFPGKKAVLLDKGKLKSFTEIDVESSEK